MYNYFFFFLKMSNQIIYDEVDNGPCQSYSSYDWLNFPTPFALLDNVPKILWLFLLAFVGSLEAKNRKYLNKSMGPFLSLSHYSDHFDSQRAKNGKICIVQQHFCVQILLQMLKKINGFFQKFSLQGPFDAA